MTAAGSLKDRLPFRGAGYDVARRKPSDSSKGIAAEHADPKLEMTEFFQSGDAVTAFGRYQATVKVSGVRVDSPVAHYFKFRYGKVARYVDIVNSGAFLEAASTR